MVVEYTVPAGKYKEGQPVDLIIKTMTDLGYKAVVDDKYWGILYYNEVFKELDKDQSLLGYIKHIRPDGRLDLTLYKPGNLDSEAIGALIIQELKKNGGFLPLGTQTEPRAIYDLFGVSKKKFKIAVSGLYKQKLILITNEGLTLR